jgi:hypothetical protein
LPFLSSSFKFLIKTCLNILESGSTELFLDYKTPPCIHFEEGKREAVTA